MPDWAKEIRAAIAPLNLDAMDEADLVEELSQDLQDRYNEMLRDGIDPEQAHQTLLRELNDGTLVSGLKGTAKAARPAMPAGKDAMEPLWQGVWQDLRHGARLLRMNPGFAMVAILSLCLGIGANTTIFQLLDAVRLRTLPVEAPEQLVRVRVVEPDRRGDFYSRNADLTGGIWNLLREQQQGFSEIAAWSPFRFNLGTGGEARQVDTLIVSGDFFNVLGVQPVLGRLISRSDDYRGCGAQGAVLSYAFWQREFGGRPDVVGRTLTLNGNAFQIMGATPAPFYGIEVGRNFDVAVAQCSQTVFATKTPLMDRPASWWIATIGRLKPGWTVERASTQLAAISPGIFAATLPDDYDASDRKNYLNLHLGAFAAATGVSGLRRDYEDPLWLLLGLSGLVLLIACANLANLMLARATSRQREMALRLTLGASRARLIRQLLAESLLLAALGTVAGAALAQILSRMLVTFLTTQQTRVFVDLTPDWRILGFAAALAILTCVLFGLAPAIQASRTEPGVAMKVGARGATAGKERLVLRRSLVVVQVALSLGLLVGALLFIRTFRNLVELNAGFQQDNVLIESIDFSTLRMPRDREMAFKRELLEQVRAVPGVISAAETVIVPLSQSGWNDNIDVPGGPQRVDVNFNRVSDGYFRTMEIPILRGRDFNGDSPKSPPVALVNETFVRKFSSNMDPIGRVFHKSVKPDENYQVIGVVKDTKYYELREEPVPIVYLSFAQENGPEESSTLMIRSNESLRSLISALKQVANDMNPSMVLNFSALKPQIRDGLLRERLMATLSGFFGALAATLAAVGLYGVISYMVVRRRSEIGVRLALGANRVDILQMILGEAAALLAVGLAVGTGLAIALGAAAGSMLYGMKPRDPFTLSVAIAIMAVVGLAASLWPAQRAATLHPMVCLREE